MEEVDKFSYLNATLAADEDSKKEVGADGSKLAKMIVARNTPLRMNNKKIYQQVMLF